MARILIWPDVYREQGHWLPCVSLAKSLEAANHRVEFMGIPDCARVVGPYGYTADDQNVKYRTIFESIYPPGYSLNEDQLEPRGQRWKPHHLLPISQGALASAIQPSDQPKADLLISGYFTALETLLISYMYNLRFVITTTYLRHPQNTPAMHAKTQLVYMPPPLAERLVKKAVELVQPESEREKLYDFDNFVARFGDYPELLPCPKQFDFTDEDWVHTEENVQYVEPMVKRPQVSGQPGASIPPGKKVIFGCSGSQVQDYESKAKDFFTNLIAMMQAENMEGYHLVLAVGSKLLMEFNKLYGTGTSSTLPANVSIFDWVSQPDVVSGAAAVFVHGGLATIKEAIYHGVPIVVVPHGKDQLDNALRVSRHGLGVIAQLEETSPLSLRKLLTAVTTSASIKRNLAVMKKVFTDAENPETQQPVASIPIINEVLSRT